MSAQEDAEIVALQAVVTALEPLPREARKRVLDWAEQRFVNPPIFTGDVDWFSKFTNGLFTESQRLGKNPGELWGLAVRLSEKTEQQEPSVDGDSEVLPSSSGRSASEGETDA